MNEFNNNPIMPSSSGGAPGPAGWIPVWIKAVSQPNEQTFIDISESPDSAPKTAYIWMFIAGTLSGVMGGIAQAINTAVMVSGQSDMDGTTIGAAVGGALIGAICASPIAGAIGVLFFALGVALVQWIAKLFGGTGTYDKLVYAVASFAAPIGLVSALFVPLNAVPILNICTGLISAGLGFYSLFLQITAVKAVNRFGWGEAAGSVLIPGAVIFTVLCACVFGILMVLGLSMGDMFNQMQNNPGGFAP